MWSYSFGFNACDVYDGVFKCSPVFPRDVLDEILNVIKSVAEGFPTYSFKRRIPFGVLNPILFINQEEIL